MPWWKKFVNSSIGLKTVMALTGLGLVGFVIAHMVGNFNAYRGAEALNSYAQTLKNLGPLLWVARIGLIVLFVVHISTAFRLTQLNKMARPVPYACHKPIQSSFASRTMIMSGLIILFFLIYHLAHFTWHLVGDIGHHIDDQGRHDVYKMFVIGFQNPVASFSYIVANLFLGLHLSHGIKSCFQTLGLRSEKTYCAVSCAGTCVAWTIAIGNISMPLSVLFGCITL
jgi:succinate dehydrogenase / fumarate reductase cytochrome b subunit